MKRGTNSANFGKIAHGIRDVYIPYFGQISVKKSVLGSYTLNVATMARMRGPNFTHIGATCRPCVAKNLKISL